MGRTSNLPADYIHAVTINKIRKGKYKVGRINFKNKTTVIVAIVISIAFFAGGFFAKGAYDNMQEKQASAVGAEFVEKVLAGDADGAYQMTSNTLREEEEEGMLRGVLSSFQADEPNKLDGVILKGNGRTLFVQYVDGLPAVGEGNTAGEFYIALVKEGKDWKVASVNIQ